MPYPGYNEQGFLIGDRPEGQLGYRSIWDTLVGSPLDRRGPQFGVPPGQPGGTALAPALQPQRQGLLGPFGDPQFYRDVVSNAGDFMVGRAAQVIGTTGDVIGMLPDPWTERLQYGGAMPLGVENPMPRRAALPTTNEVMGMAYGGEPVPTSAEIGAMFPVGPTDLGAVGLLGGAAKLAMAGSIKGARATGQELETAQGLLGRFPTTTPARIVSRTRAQGGYTVNPVTGEVPTEGIMAGRFANTSEDVRIIDSLTRAAVEGEAAKIAGRFKSPDDFLGTWIEQSSGKTYLEPTRRFPAGEVRPATKFAERSGQKALWDVGLKQEYPVGNWREFVSGPEFAKRMGEMREEGIGYLSQHQNPDWWKTYGTSLERIYGPENIPQVAGFTAATAPITPTELNTRMMTEYMRRYIKGEPIVQPEWRAPEGLLTRAPGKQLGMEAGRERNLNLAAQGRWRELTDLKVNQHAAAMMGDPMAVVLDRYWARLGEDPARGIFTWSKEAEIGSPQNYAHMMNVVIEEAVKAGAKPQAFSAEVWTGTREHIKRLNELYGQKLPGGKIPGESYGYADMIDRLVADKAKQLGVSAGEVEERLRKGDLNLLSAMLSGPLGYYAFRMTPPEPTD